MNGALGIRGACYLPDVLIGNTLARPLPKGHRKPGPDQERAREWPIRIKALDKIEQHLQLPNRDVAVALTMVTLRESNPCFLRERATS